jgi:predicted nucleic acid-binding protein
LPSSETVLCDTGPLVAIMDSADWVHTQCRAALQEFSGKLVTTWPVLSEVFYLLRKQLLREEFWKFVLGGGIEVAAPLLSDLPRMRSLMARYADLPMDFADASLVVLGERLNVRRIFTIDRRDFRVYRPQHAPSFEIFT